MMSAETTTHSVGRDQQLEQLRRWHAEDYTVDRALTAPHLGGISLVAVLGPTAIGKSTLINKVVEQDPSIHLYLSSTTRPPAARDGADYRAGVPLEEFYEAAKERSIVNYYVHPNGHAYGTFPSGFRAPATIGAIGTETLTQLKAAPFRDVHALYTISDGDTYQQRLGLDELESSSHSRIHQPDILPRLHEGLASIAFARLHLGTPGFGTIRLSNQPGALEDAAQAVSDIARHKGGSHFTSKYALTLLDEMNEVITDAIERVEQ